MSGVYVKSLGIPFNQYEDTYFDTHTYIYFCIYKITLKSQYKYTYLHT